MNERLKSGGKVRIENMRFVSIGSNEKGMVAGDLYEHPGWTFLASGSVDYLYDLCNKREHTLVNYRESVMRTTDLGEFRKFIAEQAR